MSAPWIWITGSVVLLGGIGLGVGAWLNSVSGVGAANKALAADAKALHAQIARAPRITRAQAKAAVSYITVTSASNGITISGPLTGGAALIPITVTGPHGQTVDALALVDSGAQIPQMTTALLQQVGANEISQTQMYGVSSAQGDTVGLYTGVIVRAHLPNEPAIPLVKGVTLAGGLGRTVIYTRQGISLLIGQPALTNARFTMGQGQWSWTLPGQGGISIPHVAAVPSHTVQAQPTRTVAQPTHTVVQPRTAAEPSRTSTPTKTPVAPRSTATPSTASPKPHYLTTPAGTYFTVCPTADPYSYYGRTPSGGGLPPVHVQWFGCVNPVTQQPPTWNGVATPYTIGPESWAVDRPIAQGGRLWICSDLQGSVWVQGCTLPAQQPVATGPVPVYWQGNLPALPAGAFPLYGHVPG